MTTARRNISTRPASRPSYIRLQDKGIYGNGHMVMIEKNNLDIAHVVDEWVLEKREVGAQ